MNEVFLIGRIVKKIEFDFIYHGKNISKAETGLELSNKSIIKIIGYNEIADYMYRKLNIDTRVFIEGKIQKEDGIVIKIIEIIRYNVKRDLWNGGSIFINNPEVTIHSYCNKYSIQTNYCRDVIVAVNCTLKNTIHNAGYKKRLGCKIKKKFKKLLTKL